MLQLKKIKENRESGFTLIELLVVILIIGILAAIAVPVFLNQRAKANESSLKSDLKNASIAMETEIVNKKNAYPTTLPESVRTSNGVKLSLNETVEVADSFTKKGWIKVPIKSTNANDPETYFYAKINGAFLSTQRTGEWVTADTENKDFAFSYQMNCTTGPIEKGTVDSYRLKVGKYDDWSYGNVINCRDSDTIDSVVISPDPTVNTGYNASATVTIYPPGSPSNLKPVSDGLSYCINGYHESAPNNFWHYESVGGGIKEGKCA